MKLFIDENVSRLVVDRLRVDGHDLTLARDVARDAAYEQDEPQRSDTADPRERDT